MIMVLGFVGGFTKFLIKMAATIGNVSYIYVCAFVKEDQIIMPFIYKMYPEN